MAGIQGKLIKGSLWLAVSRVVVNGLAAISTLLLARLLVPADFGLVAVATTLLAIVTSVTDLSLTSALVRHPNPTATHFSAAWTLNTLRGLLLGIAFAAAGIPTAAIYGDPRLVAVMAALGVGIAISGLANPRRIMLQRDLVFWQEFVLNVAEKLVGVVAAIVVAYVFHSYWAIVVGLLAGQATSILVSYATLPFRPRPTFAHARELLSFSVWLTAGQIIDTLNWRFDFLLVGKGLGNSALGYYSVGGNLAAIPTRETIAPLTKVMFPGFASIQNEPARLAAAYQRAQSLVTAVALPAGIGAALIAEPLVLLTMGERWRPVIFIIQALASIYALQTLATLTQSLGIAKGQPRLLFVRSLQMFAIRVPLLIAGMLIDGLRGVVLARVLTGLIAIGFNMFLVRRFIALSLRQQLAPNARSLISAAVMALLTWLLMPLLPDESDSAAMALRIACTFAAAFIIYCVSTVVLWLAMGRPAGPETEIQLLIRKAVARFRPTLS
ncbi:lipopolysaccharide biosynthesis protein [Povalibacter sp.]|uniref:lipopolysaccharide biosynthesis protein n=1 Tax=Povalibacter sp. TaxID=1962978 RepID=UPI002F422107